MGMDEWMHWAAMKMRWRGEEDPTSRPRAAAASFFRTLVMSLVVFIMASRLVTPLLKPALVCVVFS